MRGITRWRCLLGKLRSGTRKRLLWQPIASVADRGDTVPRLSDYCGMIFFRNFLNINCEYPNKNNNNDNCDIFVSVVHNQECPQKEYRIKAIRLGARKIRRKTRVRVHFLEITESGAFLQVVNSSSSVSSCEKRGRGKLSIMFCCT